MKKFHVEMLPDAKQQLDDIRLYIADASQYQIYADNQFYRIIDAIRNLSAFPERCRQAGFLGGQPLHKMIADNYSIFYTINNHTVTVTHILYGRSNIPERLGKDFSINEQEEM